MTPDAVGVTRERRFSPGKVEDDRAILELAAEGLRARGLRVEVLDGDVEPPAETGAPLVFAMCQSAERLAWLDALAARALVVNSADAIRACYRTRMLPRLDAAGVPQPAWAPAGDDPPAALGEGPWLKRGDVHAMEAGDVRRVFGPAEWAAARGELRARGVEGAVAQAHVEGPVYKFYGAGGGFFRAFGLPVGLEREAAALAAAGARALGLEVYGGDGVAGPEGLRLIDVNDWPSFSRCRDEAGAAIAARLHDLAVAATTCPGERARR